MQHRTYEETMLQSRPRLPRWSGQRGDYQAKAQNHCFWYFTSVGTLVPQSWPDRNKVTKSIVVAKGILNISIIEQLYTDAKRSGNSRSYMIVLVCLCTTAADEISNLELTLGIIWSDECGFARDVENTHGSLLQLALCSFSILLKGVYLP